jgi:hypothetical protein
MKKNQTSDKTHKLPLLFLVLGILLILSIILWQISERKTVSKISQTRPLPRKSTQIGSITEDKNLIPSFTSLNLTDEKRKRRLYFIARVLEMYYRDNGSYPLANFFVATDAENSPLRKLIPRYLSEQNLRSLEFDHHFYYWSDGKNYELRTTLTDEKDEWCKKEEKDCFYIIKNGRVISKK